MSKIASIEAGHESPEIAMSQQGFDAGYKAGCEAKQMALETEIARLASIIDGTWPGGPKAARAEGYRAGLEAAAAALEKP